MKVSLVKVLLFVTMNTNCSIYCGPLFFATFWNQINYLPTELQIANKAQIINRNNNYLFSKSEYFALINSSKLCINLEEFFIKSLNETRWTIFKYCPLMAGWYYGYTSPITVNIHYFPLFKVCLKSTIQTLEKTHTECWMTLKLKFSD